MYCGIINDEKLLERVNEPLAALREELVGKGYTEDEANNAIAGALPWSIATAVTNWPQPQKRQG